MVKRAEVTLEPKIAGEVDFSSRPDLLWIWRLSLDLDPGQAGKNLYVCHVTR